MVTTSVLHGMEAILVQVEADVSPGLPTFEMVGFLSSEVKEAKERVRTALRNCGYQLPAKRITISFSPAGIRKSGSGFDLAVAVAILAALEAVPKKRVENTIFLGELNLSGKLVPIPGILPMAAVAAEAGHQTGIVPFENQKEASLVPHMKSLGMSHLNQVVEYLRKGEYQKPQADIKIEGTGTKIKPPTQADFSEITGQKMLKRACEIAVAGRHNLLFAGPPGAGKTMAAKRIPSILPPMTERERIEVSKIYSICGMFDESQGLIGVRPFRSPHHTVSAQGLAGGGANPKPGEISLAHAGVLFLDELTEFKPGTLEILRQPMEERQIQLIRAHGKYTFPADFMLVTAMNPCKCGYYPDMQKCTCTDYEIRRYRNRISQPLLDRMDLCVKVEKVHYQELEQTTQEESSESIRERVVMAHKRQRERYEKEGFFYNSQIPAKKIATFCALKKDEKRHMQQIYETLNLSVRSYHKILKTARTIADIEGSEEIRMEHLHEAICYRSIDSNFWERRR